MNLTSIPILEDNYIWILINEKKECLIVDPGNADPVLEKIYSTHLKPLAILLTHHHYDHIDGVKKIHEEFPNLEVFGPEETKKKGVTTIVKEGDNFCVLGISFQVLYTPGHTLGHVSYYSFPYLFCGDTVFSGGCGRLFEGTYEQMYKSFQKVNKLPSDTFICSGHEYTLSNMEFALSILPNDLEIVKGYNQVRRMRINNFITLPTKLSHEKKVNLFFRVEEFELQRALGISFQQNNALCVFSILRKKKDFFNCFKK